MGASGCSQVLSVSRQLRSREVRQRVQDAVASLVSEGKVPSFYQVARRAQVSRSTLYRNAALRELVECGRAEAAAVAAGLVEGSPSPSRYLACELPRFLYGVCLLEGAGTVDGGG